MKPTNFSHPNCPICGHPLFRDLSDLESDDGTAWCKGPTEHSFSVQLPDKLLLDRSFDKKRKQAIDNRPLFIVNVESIREG